MLKSFFEWIISIFRQLYGFFCGILFPFRIINYQLLQLYWPQTKYRSVGVYLRRQRRYLSYCLPVYTIHCKFIIIRQPGAHDVFTTLLSVRTTNHLIDFRHYVSSHHTPQQTNAVHPGDNLLYHGTYTSHLKIYKI